MLKLNIKLFVLFFVGSLAWWDVGHMLTASIAEIKLTAENPYAYAHFNDLVTSINQLTDQKSQTFIQSASWPDDIKSQHYNMHLWDAWHYKDLTYLTDGTFIHINFTEAAVNSVKVIDQAVKVLRSNIQKNTAQRALFARYLIHIVGDMHQPLHSVALYNATFPKGDIGGNRIQVDLQNGSKNYNLHKFWDSGALLIQNDSYTFPRPLSLQKKAILKKMSQELIQQYGDEIEKLGQEIDPVYWSQQSLKIARNTTYPFILQNKQITEQYQQLVYQTCKKRIALAGYRLANIIKNIYQKSEIYINGRYQGLKGKEYYQKIQEQLKTESSSSSFEEM